MFLSYSMYIKVVVVVIVVVVEINKLQFNINKLICILCVPEYNELSYKHL